MTFKVHLPMISQLIAKFRIMFALGAPFFFTFAQAHAISESSVNEDARLGVVSSNALDKLITVSHQDSMVAFELSGMTDARNEGNQFVYKLEGVDEQWIQFGGERQVMYGNLSAKQYLFRFKLHDENGFRRSDEGQLAVHVLPSPWHTWWAYLIYLTIGGLCIALVVRGYLSKLKRATRYRALLEEKVRIRTAELELANQQLLNACVTDQMTGLHNRRYVYNLIDGQCAQIQREVKQALNQGMVEEMVPRLYCLMFDLDGFKPVNDTYGHDAGDRIICQVSELLKTLCRKSDTVIRWGGDEFLVMGRIQHAEEINLLAERIREALGNYSFDIGLADKVRLSCSIGYCLYPFSIRYPQNVTWEQVQVIADRALYHSKGAGRNHWTGILATHKPPPESLACELAIHMENIIEDGVVQIEESSVKNKKQQARVVLHEPNHAKAC